MNKKVITGIITALMVISPLAEVGNFNAGSATVQAARRTRTHRRSHVKWHRGVPKVLRGHWGGHGMLFQINGRTGFVSIAKGPDNYREYSVQYAKVGRNRYRMRSKWSKKDKYEYTDVFRVINRHKISFGGTIFTKRK